MYRQTRVHKRGTGLCIAAAGLNQIAEDMFTDRAVYEMLMTRLGCLREAEGGHRNEGKPHPSPVAQPSPLGKGAERSEDG